MAKAEKKSSKQAAKAKSLGGELLKEINDKVSSTKKELQKQVDELSKQVNELREEAKKPASKWFKKIEKQYQKELKKQQKEFEKRTESLLASKDKLIEQLREELIEKLPIAEKIIPAPKTPTQKATKKQVASVKKGLADLKGVGPATLKKLNDQGIETLEDLKSASADTLAAFKSVRGSNTWIDQAKDLLK